MTQISKKQLEALASAVFDLPEDERGYAARFVGKNHHLGLKELLRRWEADAGDRDVRAKLQAAHIERVTKEYEDLPTLKGSATAKVGGIALTGGIAAGHAETKE
jgi:hypothetical protein